MTIGIIRALRHVYRCAVGTNTIKSDRVITEKTREFMSKIVEFRRSALNRIVKEFFEATCL